MFPFKNSIKIPSNIEKRIEERNKKKENVSPKKHVIPKEQNFQNTLRSRELSSKISGLKVNVNSSKNYIQINKEDFRKSFLSANSYS
jgi:hypothetical protein